ncbi:hypothetical protein V6N13_079789 [Hibiscus sabdariffa]
MGGADFVKDQIDWDLMFGVVIWSLWKFRNETVFHGEELYERSILERSKYLFMVMQQTLTKERNVLRSDTRLPVDISRWHPPCMGWIKLNIGMCSTLEAELWGIYIGEMVYGKRGVGYAQIERVGRQIALVGNGENLVNRVQLLLPAVPSFFVGRVNKLIPLGVIRELQILTVP